MVTYVNPYCQINGYDFTSLIYDEGIEPSGGALGVEEIQVPGRNYADIRKKGRAPKKFKIRAGTEDREEAEIFLHEVNTAPEDSLFYPFDAARFGLIASAYATMKPKRWISSGVVKIYYELEAEITCREAWLYGPDKGFAYSTSVTLPAVSELLTNGGHETAPISYLQMSGDYVSSAYIENVSVRITPASSTVETDRSLELCDKLLRGDIFELGRNRDAVHSYETDFSKSWSEIALDIHGKVSGGSITSEILTLDNEDYIMIPFYGPLPVTGEPGACCVEINVAALSGGIATGFGCPDGVHWISALNGGGSSISATMVGEGTWETYSIVAMGAGKVALLCSDGAHYVSAAGGGGSTMSADADTAGNNETFTPIFADATHVGLKCYDGSHYVTVASGGGTTVAADADSMSTNETFVIDTTGDAAYIQVATETDLSDMAAVDHDSLVIGLNTIYVPGTEGESYVAIGIKAAAVGSISLSNLKCTVKRYVSSAQLPTADPAETFKIRVESVAGTQLSMLEVAYNDEYWY